MTRMLAIETSEQGCSVAVTSGTQTAMRVTATPREQTRRLLPMVSEVLAETGLERRDIEVIAFARGPGAFTGVRMGVAAAQGLAFGIGCPVVPVSTLAVVAEGARAEQPDGRFAVALDARMGEVYAAFYEVVEGDLKLVGSEGVWAPSGVPRADGHGWYGVGSGWRVHGEALAAHLAGCVSRHLDVATYDAGAVLRLALRAFARGEHCPAVAAIPVYLRERVTA